MKTILDVSLLGQGYYHQKARTGVFRVVENLATLLPTISPELEIIFADNLDLLSTFGYIKEHFNGQEINFLNENSQVSAAKLQNQILSFFPYNSTPQKALKRLFYQYNNNKQNPFQIEKIASSKLFHSPYFPFPSQIQESKRIKKLITIHDLIPIKFPQFFENKTDNVVHKIIQSIQPDNFAICVSEATKVDLLEISGLDESQVFVAPLAASNELFYPVCDQDIINQTLQKFAIPINQPYFLSISTLEPRKNIDAIIKCFADLILQEKNEDLNLVLVGIKGWDFEKIYEAISITPQIKNRIIFTGYVPDEDLAALYSGALSFVYMSFCEGFGLPPLEAMQCGTPVICSNTTSLPEVLGDAGILVSPTNFQDISKAMLSVYQNDDDYRKQLKQKSIERASQFSWQKFAHENFNIYQKIE
jgi:glycosyltransferase involved in cell wall biosynthesis